jgi:hypothetical protein
MYYKKYSYCKKDDLKKGIFKEEIEYIETVALIYVSLTRKHIKLHKFNEPEDSLKSKESEARLFCEFVSCAYGLLKPKL